MEWRVTCIKYLLINSTYSVNIVNVTGAIILDAVGRVTWGMTAPGGKTVPPSVDNLKLPRTFTEYTEWCYHLPDTCFE